MEPKPHGLSAKAACRVYAYIQQQGGFSLAELRDAVNFAEPVTPKEVDYLAGKTVTQC